MRKILKSRFFIISISIVLLLLSTALWAAFTHSISPVRDTAMRVSLPGQRFFTHIYTEISDFFSAYTRYNDLKAENDTLLSRIAVLEYENRLYTSIEEENEALRTQLSLSKRSGNIDYLAASLVAADTDDMRGCFIIDCGSADDIKPGMAVVTPRGLAGFIDTCSTHSCTVLPVTGVGSACAVRTVRTHCTGTAEGDIELSRDGLVRMNYIDNSDDICTGDIIETSGADGLYPHGIAVGIVESVHYEEHALSRFALIKPFQTLAGMRNVFVITGFREA